MHLPPEVGSCTGNLSMSKKNLECPSGPTTTAYKLLRLRRDGTLGPLFINRKQVIPVGEWLPAEVHPTRGYALRPGWHAAKQPVAPHLTTRGRVWMQVQLAEEKELPRPASQGGMWLIANWIKVIGPVAERNLVTTVSS